MEYDTRAFFEVAGYLKEAYEASRMVQRNLLNIRYNPESIWVDALELEQPSPDGSRVAILAEAETDANTFLYEELDKVLKIASQNLELVHEVFAMPDIDFDEVDEEDNNE